MQPIVKLVIAGTAMFATLGLIAGLSGMYSLNIKAKTVGHGQHGTARWATKGEIKKTYTHVNIPPQTGQQNGGNRSRVTVEMSPGVRLQVQAVE